MVLDRIGKRSVKSADPVKLIIRGEPGIGKSSLVDRFLEQLGAEPFLNPGQGVLDVLGDDCLDDLAAQLRRGRVDRAELGGPRPDEDSWWWQADPPGDSAPGGSRRHPGPGAGLQRLLRRRGRLQPGPVSALPCPGATCSAPERAWRRSSGQLQCSRSDGAAVVCPSPITQADSMTRACSGASAPIGFSFAVLFGSRSRLRA